MQKSLKKQIFQNKVSNLLKTRPIILFFATFHLPQKQRGKLKKQINLILNKKVNFACKKSKVLILSKNASPFLSGGSPLSTLMYQHLTPYETLHISNKCFQNLIKSYELPLYGQTLIIALREEDLVFFSTFLSLYKGIFLGGFYKNRPQTKKYFTALCNKAEEKKKIKEKCISVLSATYKNYLKTLLVLPLNLLRLLNHISIKLKHPIGV